MKEKSVEWTDKQRAIVNNLIDIAWNAGAVRAPQMAQELEILRMQLQEKKPCSTDAKEQKP